MVRSLEGKHPNYFEAKLQLREVSQEVVDFVEDALIRKKIPVTKAKKVRNGFDFYLPDKDVTRALGKRLQQHFGGQLKITASLFGKKKGKELYRVTVLFRPIPFKKGETVEYQGEQYNVKMIGKDILLQHLKTGKKEHVKYDNMKEISSTTS